MAVQSRRREAARQSAQRSPARHRTTDYASERPTPFVGRDAELAAVLGAIDTSPAVVMIEGEAGIGKSRLIREVANQVRGNPTGEGSRAGRVLVGACRRVREPFPLAPVIEALRGLRDHAEELRTARLSPVTGALRSLIPEIADVLPMGPPPLDDRAAERHRVFRGLVELCGSLGWTVLVLEDMHWADDQTVEFLAYMVTDMPSRLAVVLTLRGQEVDPAIRAATAKVGAADETTVKRVEVSLGPLNADQTGTLAASLLHEERVSQEFAAHLCQRASGVPLAIEELLALLRSRGSLTRTKAGWVRRAIDELDVPSGIRDPVRERVNRLSAEARAVIEAAAVLQEPVPVPVLVEVCRADEADASRGVEEALLAGLLVEDGDSVGFRHVLAAQAVYDGLVGPQRQNLHSRAAHALRAHDPVPLGQLAHHLRNAGRTAEWADAAERAADQAVALNHNEEAARLLEDVVRLTDLEPERRGRLAVKLGRAGVESLHAASGIIGHLSDVLDQDMSSETRGQLAFWLAMAVEKEGGDPAEQRKLYLQAVEYLDNQPGLKAWAMMGLAIAKVPGVALAEHKEWVNRVLDTLSAIDDPPFETLLLGKAASVLAELGDPGWRPISERLVERASGTPRHRREVNAFYSVGFQACYLGDYATASRLLEAAMAGAVSSERSLLQLRVRAARALLDYRVGDWDGQPEKVAALLDDLSGDPLTSIGLEVVEACLAISHGDLDDAQDKLRVLAPRSREMGEFDAYAIAVAALTRVEVSHSDFDEATTSVVDQFVTDIELYDLWVPMSLALPAVVEFLVAIKKEAAARELVTRCSGEWRRLDVPLGPAALQAATGVLDLLVGEWAAAAERFVAASERYEALSAPYEAAQAREQTAKARFESEADDASAAEILLAALSTYRNLGASWDAARCMQLARMHGIRLPVPYRGGRKGYGDALSPREAQIARLAGTGLSNKEIADEVFLSPRTVSTHMSRAMRKLGVRSRSALAARLAEGLPDDADQG